MKFEFNWPSGFGFGSGELKSKMKHKLLGLFSKKYFLSRSIYLVNQPFLLNKKYHMYTARYQRR